MLKRQHLGKNTLKDSNPQVFQYYNKIQIYVLTLIINAEKLNTYLKELKTRSRIMSGKYCQTDNGMILINLSKKYITKFQSHKF